MEQKVLEFLKNRNPKLCTIATVTPSNTPTNTVVGYAVTEDLKILINTNLQTRKWKNLEQNKSVALVFGWSFEEINIQYEGTAELIDITNPKFQDLENFFFLQNIEARKFKSENTRIILISPKWLRLMDPTVTPPTVDEKSY